MARESLSSSLNKLTYLGILQTKFASPTKLKSLCAPSHRFFCKQSSHEQLVKLEMAKYKETFFRRMALAGLKPHHKIAIGVSGGPDSVALCVLAAGWKTNAHVGVDDADGCIEGLLAIVVDHNLRLESKDEANCVRERITKMGIRCEIAHCDWSDGRPKQGHLQEMARDMRYHIFQNVCIQKQIGVLLIGHHADDQAELFILRLSRNSGVLGLAGMAFTSQLFPTHVHHCGETSCSHGMLLICRGGQQEWVEDPTNQSQLFARNRIRTSLRNLSSSIMDSELQAIISACRRTRSFIDKVCAYLIKKAVIITIHGYAIIDLEKLDPLNVEDVSLSKFSALVLQFISQRHRQVRGRTSKLVLDYLRNFPCKTSLTAASCYLCPAPQSKGTKVLVCSSLHSPHPSETESSQSYPCEEKRNCLPREVEQIIMDGKQCSDSLTPDASNVPFLYATSSETILSEAKRLNILGESTYNTTLSLQIEETKRFKTKAEGLCENEPSLRHGSTSGSSLGEPLQSGRLYHFLNRFLVSWKLEGEICESCRVGHDKVAAIRHMVDTDWLYLANLSKGQMGGECHMDETTKKVFSCSEYAKRSAERALRELKLIPVAARRGLPVLVNSQGLLLSIPSISFEHCPYLVASAVFKPRVPLGNGHTSFI